MRSRPIEPSSSLPEATDRLLTELGEWVAECVTKSATAEPRDGHDQMTYTTGWEPWIVARDGDSGLDFPVGCRGAVRDHRVRTGQPSLTLVPRKLRQRRGEVAAVVCAPVAYAVQFAIGHERRAGLHRHAAHPPIRQGAIQTGVMCLVAN